MNADETIAYLKQRIEKLEAELERLKPKPKKRKVPSTQRGRLIVENKRLAKEGKRRCTRCLEVKPAEAYQEDKRVHDGRKSICRECYYPKVEIPEQHYDEIVVVLKSKVRDSKHPLVNITRQRKKVEAKYPGWEITQLKFPEGSTVWTLKKPKYFDTSTLDGGNNDTETSPSRVFKFQA
jgi:hypothetical protein